MAAPPAGHGGAVERALSGAIAAPSRELRSVGSHGSAALRPLGAIAGAPLHFQRAAETGPHPGDAVDGRRTKRARALEEGGLPGDIALLQECGQSGWRSRDMGASECLLRRAAGCDDRSAGSPRARKRIKRAWGVSLAVPSETPPAEVIAGRLYIGSRAQAQNWALLQGLGITHIVNVSRESCEPFAGRVAYHQCGIPDTDEADLTGPCASSRRFIDAAFAADAGARVLVHCASGVSRSVAVAMHYLSCTHTGLGYEGALAHIRAVHPAAQPNRGFVTQLREMESRRREAACEGGESCGGGESFGGGACGGGEDGGEGLVGRSESCASIARTESSGSVAVGGEAGLSRVSSWARVASTEDVGWISRTPYPAAKTCGWMTRVPSVEKRAIVDAGMARVPSWSAATRARDSPSPVRSADPQNEDCHSEASTRLARSEPVSEASEVSETSEEEEASSPLDAEASPKEAEKVPGRPAAPFWRC